MTGAWVARRDPIDRPVAAVRDEGEASAYADRARRLGLSFTPVVRLGSGATADIAAIVQGTFAMSVEGERVAYLAPDETAMPGVLHWLGAYPSARRRLRVSTPSAIRAALVRACEQRLVDDAVQHLEGRYPHLSARRVATGRQIAAGLLLAPVVALTVFLHPVETLVCINLIGAVFFFGVSVLRFVAAGLASGRRPIDQTPVETSEINLPSYTILVPLYGEAALVHDLVAAIDELDWPRECLDIKLILEAGDSATIAAARRATKGAPYEIVLVPEGGPRTKPKALAFALPFARGEFVTVYDAEDRPHPQQLREAFAVFARSGPELACLQSALVVDNGDASWLTLLFAIEYAALFDGLLPALATLGMPLPLGGTSNHFRRVALEAVGGWDPFNVTEDADLGFRLAASATARRRLSYRHWRMHRPR